MEGQQLPKATMNSFVRAHTSTPFSADFVNKLLVVSKEFVVRLSDRANDICEQNNKKTISAQHLEQALESFGLRHHITKLREIGSNIKEINQLKREASQRLEENIEKQMREEREKRMNEEPEKKQVHVREKFEMIEVVNQEYNENEEEFDYEKMAGDEPQVNEEGDKEKEEKEPKQDKEEEDNYPSEN